MTRSEMNEKSSTEIFTRKGGIFWGLVLLIVGLLWLLGALDLIVINLEVLLPLVVMLAGLWLIVTKATR